MTRSPWARRRQILYGTGVFLFFAVIIIPIVFFYVYEPPSCFDGKQNQGETAIDRGGPCVLADERTLQQYAVLWSRAFPVREGFYNTVAYIENPNQGVGVFDAAYQFRVYDERNILIAERFGRVPIFPGSVFPIFESRIDTGNRIPVRTFFSFTGDLSWERMEDPALGLEVLNERTSDLDLSPRIDAVLRNSNVTAREDVVVVATVFDPVGNAIASSRTYIPRIGPNERLPIAFTWPRPFTDDVGRIDIVSLSLPTRAR